MLGLGACTPVLTFLCHGLLRVTCILVKQHKYMNSPAMCVRASANFDRNFGLCTGWYGR